MIGKIKVDWPPISLHAKSARDELNLSLSLRQVDRDQGGHSAFLPLGQIQ